MIVSVLFSEHERKIVAALATIFSLVGAILIMRFSGATRVEQTIIINIISLALLTVIFAIPGTVIGLYALWQLWNTRQLTPLMVFGFIGTVLATVACFALAIAVDCVPHCKGRGGLLEGLLMAAPAGFAAGTACCFALRISNSLVMRLRN
jgi:hypothetical protein